MDNINKKTRGKKKLPDDVRKKPKYQNTGMIEYTSKKGDEIPLSFFNGNNASNDVSPRIVKVKFADKKLLIDKFYDAVALKNNLADKSLIEKIVNFRTQMIIKLINNTFEGKIMFKEFFTFEPDYNKLRYIIKSGIIFDKKYDGIRDKILTKSFLESINLSNEDISLFLNRDNKVDISQQNKIVDKPIINNDEFYEEL